MSIEKLEHCAIRTSRLAQTRRFYEFGLGLRVGDRPPLPVHGYWLYAGATAVIHLIEVSEQFCADVFGDGFVAQERPQAVNDVDHLAFRATDMDATRARLQQLGLPIEEREIPAMNLRQMFVRDPNGITAELNFVS